MSFSISLNALPNTVKAMLHQAIFLATCNANERGDLCAKMPRAAWHILSEIKYLDVIELALGPYWRNIGRVFFCTFMDLTIYFLLSRACDMQHETFFHEDPCSLPYFYFSETIQVQSLITLVHSNKPWPSR